MSIRVVVIDDDADFVWLTRVSLQREHDITVIGDAQEGETSVALALREQPDIVVTDLMMPPIDGFEVAKRIKESRPTVKVLAVTALSLDNAIGQNMYCNDIDAFLSKRDVATALAPMIRSLHEGGTSPR